MSAQDLKPAERLRKLAYLTKDYMPDARWTVGGALRFDQCLIQLAAKMRKDVEIRTITQVSANPPCLWSLDWFTQRRPISGMNFIKLLEAYAKLDVGITLEFDNPFIREEDLRDPYALALVMELARRNGAHRHAISVASDLLAQHLRKHVPTLPIYCHVNRLLVEPAGTTRDAAFYNMLAQRYNRVCLHPADAVNPAIYRAMAEPRRMDVVINDPCLRSCPSRAAHLQMLADYRREPYNPTHGQRRIALLNQVGCLGLGGTTPQQKRACNLTKAESRALYEAGYRSFLIQSQQFRNEMTLMWDVIQCMFAPTPETSNKVAVLLSSCLIALAPKPRFISSGLKDFTTESYD